MPIGAEPAVYNAAQAERQPLLDTLQSLVNIESGSKDFPGVSYIAQVAADKLKALGGEVQIIRSTDPERLQDTPEQPGPAVQAVYKGSGHSRIMRVGASRRGPDNLGPLNRSSVSTPLGHVASLKRRPAHAKAGSTA